ncbi:carboxylating nicotinate-nucleotide diphosphorylase [Crassaminicella thermophila]|uniref:Probable nicotinate-nucleotide pyrophosphorylase [carboxylating] n=1 Tax=Crassaminicella thermophila TaxID=2599308 RepID=A0A5C0S8Q5_CRATE|nr:carboxylating nicotinate-nucleotide diphosphorylase [Crassaminicella thermophila]QEK10913.1 carboxylating nicotinate-nucleotide diphosphorylase [Crassaminicella thermophila]
MYNKFLVEKIIKNALIEDMNYGDTTTDLLIDDESISEGIMIAKEDGIVAGIPVAEMVFKLLDDGIEFYDIKNDGEMAKKGDHIVRIKGSTKNILKGERLALNLMQRMSGIATKARLYADAVKEYNTRIVDTRKTTPGLRILEKYAVRIGGCYNHRFNLSDAVMIKDNHIMAVGGIKKAVEKVRRNISHTTKIEVEVKNLKELEEALEVNADIIMLDNMDIETMKQAVEITDKRAILEASGNITIERLKDIAKIGVDIISVGALTHSVKAMDISFMIIRS